MGIVLRQINEPLPRISDLAPSVHESISQWVGWLASKSPSDRPQSAEQAWDALDTTLLAVLGPMWRRGASLVAPSQVPEPIAVPTARPTPRPPEPTASSDAAAAAAAVVAAAAGAATAAEAPAAAAASAATMPPRTRVAKPSPVTRGPYRVPAVVKALIVVAGLIAVGALAINAGNGAQIQSAAEQSGSSVTHGTPTRAPSPAASPATSPAASPAQPSPIQTTRAALADQAAAAQQLATTYRSAATQISQQSTTGALNSDDAALVTALQGTASAYDKAAAAATAGDVAGYTSALAAADASKAALSSLLNRAPAGGTPASSSPPPTSTPTSTRASSCAGDSQSDDPSDDACGPA
jgi:hypothetical protein